MWTSRNAFKILIAGSLLVTMAAVAGGPAGYSAPVTPTADAAPLPLRVVDRKHFCTRLANVFADYGRSSGYDHVQTTLLASGATASVMQEFRAGRATDFVNAKALASYSNVPDRAPDGGYLPLAGIVGGAMGIAGEVTLALSPAELRFIPHAQRGLDIVVIARNAAAITPARAQKIAELARSMAIKIHVMWVGDTDANGPAVAEARSLAWLAAVTGGSIANLGGPASPCGEVS